MATTTSADRAVHHAVDLGRVAHEPDQGGDQAAEADARCGVCRPTRGSSSTVRHSTSAARARSSIAPLEPRSSVGLPPGPGQRAR